MDMVRSMISFAQLPDSFQGYALETIVYILNNVPSNSVSETPYDLWKEHKESLCHFIIQGCPTYVLEQNPKKLKHRLKLYLFTGYPKESRDGLFYDPLDNKVLVLTNVTFLEKNHIGIINLAVNQY